MQEEMVVFLLFKLTKYFIYYFKISILKKFMRLIFWLF